MLMPPGLDSFPDPFPLFCHCRAEDSQVLQLRQGVFGPAIEAVDMKQDSKAKARTAHGALMAVNFILIMPLGALAARHLRCHWIKVHAVRAALFYVHIITQVMMGGVP